MDTILQNRFKIFLREKVPSKLDKVERAFLIIKELNQTLQMLYMNGVSVGLRDLRSVRESSFHVNQYHHGHLVAGKTLFIVYNFKETIEIVDICGDSVLGQKPETIGI